MILRSNQIPAVSAGERFFMQKEAPPSIIVAPVAFGKSILIAKVAEGIKDKLIVLQPTKELLEQNYNKFVMLGGQAEIFSASMKQKNIGAITYATLGSIKSIGPTIMEMGITKMIVDEIHQYPRSADSMFGTFIAQSGISHVLGLTATPLKLQTNFDMEGFAYSKLQMLTSRSKKGSYFKEIIYVAQVQEMITNGFWCKLIYNGHKIDDTQLKLNSTKAEYTPESLLVTYHANDVELLILNRLKRIDDRKSILVFVPSVEQAISLSAKVPDSAAVYGDMPDKHRSIILQAFKKGSVRIIFNCMLLTTGYDNPEIDCIILGSSTMSFSLYYQMIGRGTRISPNKKDCLVIDFGNNINRFGGIEHIYYKKENIWKLYGEDGRLLSGVPVHEIGTYTEETERLKRYTVKVGKYSGKSIEEIFAIDKEYCLWMRDTFDWNKYNIHLKNEIERLLMQPRPC